MSRHTITVGRGVAIAGGVGLLVLGAAGTFVMLRTSGHPRAPAAATPAAAPHDATGGSQAGAAAPPAEVVINLTPQAIERAGIVVATVASADDSPTLRVPGIVEPHGYRKVVVTPIVSGRVTRVLAELGQRVRRGQALAIVYSPELADAHARFRAARAALDAHDRELQRVERLATIGAESRQELERTRAAHTAAVADVDSTRARLELLGGTPAATEAHAASPSATVDVPAPLDGTVIERGVNTGANVGATTPLMTVADLSTVWVVADVYEQDLGRVRVGSDAVVTVSAYDSARIEGRVSYIDPQVSAATRSAKLRVELPNRDERLRIGMYVDVQLSVAPARNQPSAPSITIPKAAVQTVGEQSVVYVAGPDAGRFTERTVRMGATMGDRVQALSGVTPGDTIVVEGSFFLRAEAERLGLHQR